MVGIKKISLKEIKSKKGNILKFLSKKNNFYKKFGEIYFSEIKFGKTKGWNYHKRNKCHLSVISGRVKFHFLKKGKKKYFSKKITLSRKNYSMIIIDPKIFFSFKGLGKKNIIVNFMQNSHDPKETIKFSSINNIKIEN